MVATTVQGYWFTGVAQISGKNRHGLLGSYRCCISGDGGLAGTTNSIFSSSEKGEFP